MGALNIINWEVLILHFKNSPEKKCEVKKWNDYECIVLGLNLRKIANKTKQAAKTIEMPLIGAKVNLYSLAVEDRQG